MGDATHRTDGDDGYSIMEARQQLDRAAAAVRVWQQNAAYWTQQLSVALARDGARPWPKPVLKAYPLERRA
jgi:hypothetical protein